MRIAVIPARGGSKRIPHKNIRDFRGKPMIHYAIEAADGSDLFESIVVSTDSQEVAEVASACETQTPVVIAWRPEDDGSRGTQEIAAELLKGAGWRTVDQACVIYPCVPMLVRMDLHRAFITLKRDHVRYAMSVTSEPLADAGMFYAGYADAWRNSEPLISHATAMIRMPANRAIDINTEDDWKRAERMYDAWRALHV